MIRIEFTSNSSKGGKEQFDNKFALQFYKFSSAEKGKKFGEDFRSFRGKSRSYSVRQAEYPRGPGSNG